ncbi:Fibropellin-1 [Chionoecetes opilio]|uniref:Fibropellin-1 n=1 Tax=Chionoecetes opilio TaxID=41210 RepID=A0A8J4XZ74_CHIOP|nr:Fibropellin-1 [Chionoecetes opilio]
MYLLFAEDGIPLSLDVFEDFVYFTTLHSNTVNHIYKFGNQNQGIMPISQHPVKVNDVLIVQEQKQDKRIPNPCSNATCHATMLCVLSGPRNYSCLCPDGTLEKTVADHLECHAQVVVSSSFCQLFCLKGECVQTAQGPKCKCDPKFDGEHCDHYRCSDHCKNGGLCQVEVDMQLSCLCQPNWTGVQCETLLPTCNNFCENNGTCHEMNGEAPYCTCNAMFTGDRCDQCKALTCENGGTCRAGMRKGSAAPMCSCGPGYHGVNCSFSVCEDYCNHGSCFIQSMGMPTCKCKPGWTGRRCDNCANETLCAGPCVQLECLNGGNCIVTPPPASHARCSCMPGYSGQFCQYSVCDSCINGQCYIQRGMPRCECDPGWTGTKCETKKCHEGDQRCGCRPGYHGKNCEHYVCENYCHKGLCVVKEGDPVCQCPRGFSGDRCQHNDCEHLCHRGSCQVTEEGAKCVCEEGYTGRRCMEPVPSGPCSPSPCLHGGSCVVVHGKGLCNCSLEYHGSRCQSRVEVNENPCANLSCLHGGVCQMVVSTAVCRCTEGWAGDNCDVQTACMDDWCFHGGTCRLNSDPTQPSTCDCPEGFTGLRCEATKDERLEVSSESSANTATVIIGIFVAVVVLVVAVVVAWMWQRQRAKGISHVRLEENGGTVEMTNPMYLHVSSDQEEEPNPVFSLHDSPNTFKNPVYDSLYNEAAAAQLSQEKTGLLQSDPLGVLDTNGPTGSKS